MLSGGNLASPGRRLGAGGSKRPCLAVLSILLRRGYGTYVERGVAHAGQRVEEGHAEVSSVSVFGIIKNNKIVQIGTIELGRF